MNQFQKEGYPKRTIYNTINRLQLGGTIKDKKNISCYKREKTPKYSEKTGGESKEFVQKIGQLIIYCFMLLHF